MKNPVSVSLRRGKRAPKKIPAVSIDGVIHICLRQAYG